MDAGLLVATRQGAGTTLSSAAVEQFERSLQGTLLTPERDGYEESRKVWNGLIDRRPAMIVRCRSSRDVAAAVRLARANDLVLSVRAGGHNVAGRAIAEAGVVIDLSELRAVQVDSSRGVVRAEAGARLADLDAATLPRGLAVPVGLVGATGVAGLALHGGYGWLTRRHGLTCDNLVGAEMVLADGTTVEVDEQRNPDLLWALRGGGGNFGVVTALVLRAHPIAERVWAVAAFYSLDRGEEVLRGWRDQLAKAPEELSSLVTLWSAPHGPPAPPEVQGAPVAVVAACYSGPFERAEAVVEPLRQFGTPLLDLSGPTSFADWQRFFDADYPDGRLYYWKSLYLPVLDNAAIATLVGHAWERPSALTSVDVWALGGAVRRVPSEASAFAHREVPFLLAIESNWDEPERTRDNVEWTREVHRDLQRFGAGAYLNFPGFAEEGDRLLEDAYGRNLERLRHIKRSVDPDNLFRGNFNIAP